MDIRRAGVNGTVVSQDGTIIAFTRLGHGPPLVLVDGAFCYRGNGPTLQLASLLARRFTVYAYDRRGRGESGDSTAYAIQREVEDLAAVVHAAGGSACLFAMSSGAGIVLRAVEHGTQSGGIALYEPPFIKDRDGQPRQLGQAITDLEQLVAAGRRTESVTYFMTEVIGVPRAFVRIMRVVRRATWRKNESVAHTLPRDLAVLNDWSVLSAGSSVTIPALILGGAKSTPELQAAVTTVADALPNSLRRMLKSQSHSVSMKVLAPVLEEFFLGQYSAPSPEVLGG